MTKQLLWGLGIVAVIIWIFNKYHAAQSAGATFTGTPPQRGVFGSGPGVYGTTPTTTP